MVAVSEEEMDGPATEGIEPGGTFELRRRKVVECAKETLENGN